MTKDAPDHSADAVRYVLIAANQGQHNHRTKEKSGAHPLMWTGRGMGQWLTWEGVPFQTQGE